MLYMGGRFLDAVENIRLHISKKFYILTKKTPILHHSKHYLDIS